MKARSIVDDAIALQNAGAFALGTYIEFIQSILLISVHNHVVQTVGSHEDR